jgi:hypothetical protein
MRVIIYRIRGASIFFKLVPINVNIFIYLLWCYFPECNDLHLPMSGEILRAWRFEGQSCFLFSTVRGYGNAAVDAW